LWEYSYKKISAYKKERSMGRKVASLSSNELRLLDNLRQEKMLTYGQDKIKRSDDYKTLRELERKGFVECSIDHGYGGKFYHFSILSSMSTPIREFFSNNKIEDVGGADEK